MEEKQGRKHDASGSLGFAARSMSHVSVIPLSQWRFPDGHPILEYTKSDGGFNLTVQASQRYGLPFGPDRDLLYWAVAETKKRKTRTIEFKSMRDLARQLGRSECGKGLSALQESVMRLHHAVIFTSGVDEDGMRFSSECRGSIITKVNLPFEPEYTANKPFSITLNEEFAKRPIAINTDILRELGENYGAKDLYVFLVRRWHSMIEVRGGKPRLKNERPLALPWDEIKNQFGFDPETPLFKVRQMFKGWVDKLDITLKKFDRPTKDENGNLNPRMGSKITCTTQGVTFKYRKPIVGRTRAFQEAFKFVDNLSDHA